MTKRKIIFTFLVTVVAFAVYSQKNIQAEDLSVTNLGDGRWEYKEKGKDKLLSGTYKIIDGRQSEYAIAKFKKGLNDGEFAFYKKGVLIYKCNYKEGVLAGLRTDYYPDGSMESERFFVNGKLDGLFKTYYPDGSLQKEKGYKDGKEHGIDRTFEPGSTTPKTELNYYEGFYDGIQVRNQVSSNVGTYSEIAHYNRGIRTGDFLETWMNGVIKQSGRYENGEKEGLWLSNYENGNRRQEITYRAGKPYGEAKSYFKDGSLELYSVYSEDGKDKVTKEYFPNGGLSSEFTYYEDIREGPYKLYYEDGTLREEGRCENGREVYFKQYYKNGQVKEIRQFTGRNGWEIIESYDADGTQR